MPTEDQDPRVYMRVLNYVREQVCDGTLPPGARPPSITALCKRFGCARHTAGKALQILAGEGMLVRYPGLGYFVRQQDRNDG